MKATVHHGKPRQREEGDNKLGVQNLTDRPGSPCQPIHRHLTWLWSPYFCCRRRSSGAEDSPGPCPSSGAQMRGPRWLPADSSWGLECKWYPPETGHTLTPASSPA